MLSANNACGYTDVCTSYVDVFIAECGSCGVCTDGSINFKLELSQIIPSALSSLENGIFPCHFPRFKVISFESKFHDHMSTGYIETCTYIPRYLHVAYEYWYLYRYRYYLLSEWKILRCCKFNPTANIILNGYVRFAQRNNEYSNDECNSLTMNEKISLYVNVPIYYFVSSKDLQLRVHNAQNSHYDWITTKNVPHTHHKIYILQSHYYIFYPWRGVPETIGWV